MRRGGKFSIVDSGARWASRSTISTGMSLGVRLLVGVEARGGVEGGEEVMGETGVVCNVSCLAFWRRTSRDASTAGWSSCFPIMMDTVVANCWRRALSESSVKVMVGGGS